MSELFSEERVKYIKHCMFAKNTNHERIIKETGLTKAQVLMWAEIFNLGPKIEVIEILDDTKMIGDSVNIKTIQEENLEKIRQVKYEICEAMDKFKVMIHQWQEERAGIMQAIAEINDIAEKMSSTEERPAKRRLL
jgi:hypothetical protein